MATYQMRKEAIMRQPAAAALCATLGLLSPTIAQAQISEFSSDLSNWLYNADDAQRFAFDSFYPGVDDKGDLTPQTVTLDLGVTHLTVTRNDGGGALRDASIPFGWVSDAPLYSTTGPGSTWEFSTPIYSMYVYYGSLSLTSRAAMRLYSNGQEIATVTRYGGAADGVFAVGFGFVSQTPIDKIDFFKAGAGDSVLIGAFVGLANGEPSLGTVRIPGYQGPHGELVDYDFALTTTRPNPFKLTASQLFGGQSGDFSVVGGLPSTRTYLIYSMAGLGQIYVPQLDVTAGIRNPVLAGSPKNTDASGAVSWRLPIPANARGRDVWFQALQQRHASTIVATWIN